MAQGKGHARLGNYTFRLDPEDIRFDYKVNYSVIDTLGGQVVQVIGATIGDITIRGSFGEDRKNKKVGWEMAESFQHSIKAMIDQQTLMKQGYQHPLRFTYLDGTHDWDFSVLIKSVSETDGSGAVEHRSGKYAYGFILTLFLVSDNSLVLKKVAQDKFISRIANGLGWKNSAFNGSMSLDAAMKFIRDHSPNDTVQSYYYAAASGLPEGTSVDIVTVPDKPPPGGFIPTPVAAPSPPS